MVQYGAVWCCVQGKWVWHTRHLRQHVRRQHAAGSLHGAEAGILGNRVDDHALVLCLLSCVSHNFIGVNNVSNT